MIPLWVFSTSKFSQFFLVLNMKLNDYYNRSFSYDDYCFTKININFTKISYYDEKILINYIYFSILNCQSFEFKNSYYISSHFFVFLQHFVPSCKVDFPVWLCIGVSARFVDDVMSWTAVRYVTTLRSLARALRDHLELIWFWKLTNNSWMFLLGPPVNRINTSE